MSRVPEFSRPSTPNNFSVGHSDLTEHTRTRGSDPDMRRGAWPAVVPLATTPGLHPQPAINSLPLSSTGASNRGSSLKSDSAMIPYEDGEARVQDQIAEALHEAMETDCHYQHSRHGSGSRPPSFQRLRSPGLRPMMLTRPMGTTPVLDLARQTTLPTASAQLHPLPSSSASYNTLLKSSSPTLLPQNAQSRTSIDTLRSIQSRSLKRYSLPSGWLQNFEPLLDERDKEDAEETAEDKLRKRYAAPREACVLAHGLLGFDSVSVATIEFSYWRGIKEALEAIGCEVLIARVPATSSIEERAKVFEAIISRELPGRKVHLIGHSMGGLDSRYLASRLRSDRFTPISVTTIASPHRGSTFATTFLQLLGRELMPQFLQFLDLLPNGGGDGGAFQSLTPEAMSKFNGETPDAQDVQYFSFGASYNPGLIDTFKWPHGVIMSAEGPNDGLVSVESSKWGKYVRTLENVNHLDLVGWVNAARFAWADLTGNSIKFKPATFYLEIVDMLAREVEGQPGKPGDKGVSVGQESPQVDTAPPTIPQPSHQK